MTEVGTTTARSPARQRPPINARYRWRVAARLLAALAGGYLLANAAGVLLARLLQLGGVDRAGSVIAAMMFSFLVCAGAVLWAFAARSAARAWWGMSAAALVCGAAAWLMASAP